MPDCLTQTLQRQAPARRRRKFLVADLFCGAGGSSTGARRALEAMGLEMVLTAVNHWPVAVETHSINHPGARHYCQDIATLRPRDAVPEGYLDLLMASPTCTYHSRARGGRPTSDQQRMDPWHIVTWCTELRVRRLMVENVPEFVDWGPVDARTGRPVKSRKGEYFRAWVRALRAIGLRVDWRILNCADYGDATTRQRFFLLGRADGRRPDWPTPTHSRDGATTLFGPTLPWRPAREIIDWSIPGRSIYGRPKPLAPNTLRRIEAGLIKLGGDAAAPYLPRLRAEIERAEWYKSLSPEERRAYLRAQKEARSRGDVGHAAAGRHHFLVKLRGTSSAAEIAAPLPSITAGGNHLGVVEMVEPFLLNRHGENGGVHRGSPVDAPLPTITTRGAGYLIEPDLRPFVLSQASGGAPRPVDDPLPTFVARQGQALIEPMLVHVNHAGDHGRPQLVDTPLPTVTGKRGVALVQPFVVSTRHTDGYGPGARPVDQPLPTITAGGSQVAVVEPFVTPYYGGGSGTTGKAVAEPLDTITTKPRFALVEPFLLPQQSGDGRPADKPLSTVTTVSRIGLVEPLIVPQFGEGPGQSPRFHSVDAPLPAVTSHGAGALVEPILVETDQAGGLGSYCRSVDQPLPTAVTKRNLVVVEADHDRYDIRLRMIRNHELARAMSFDDDETRYEFVGTQEEITRQIGNAVPCRTAQALVSAIAV